MELGQQLNRWLAAASGGGETKGESRLHRMGVEELYQCALKGVQFRLPSGDMDTFVPPLENDQQGNTNYPYKEASFESFKSRIPGVSKINRRPDVLAFSHSRGWMAYEICVNHPKNDKYNTELAAAKFSGVEIELSPYAVYEQIRFLANVMDLKSATIYALRLALTQGETNRIWLGHEADREKAALSVEHEAYDWEEDDVPWSYCALCERGYKSDANVTASVTKNFA